MISLLISSDIIIINVCIWEEAHIVTLLLIFVGKTSSNISRKYSAVKLCNLALVRNPFAKGQRRVKPTVMRNKFTSGIQKYSAGIFTIGDCNLSAIFIHKDIP